MNQVVYFSAGGNSKAVAEYVAQQLNWPIYDATSYADRVGYSSPMLDCAVVVLPVYGQSITPPCRELLSQINAKHFCLLFTFGKMKAGNVLKQANRLVQGTMIGAALIPGNHTYQQVGAFVDFLALTPLLAKLKQPNPSAIAVPSRPQHWLRWVFPVWRSQHQVKLTFDIGKCHQCGICETLCPVRAVVSQQINRSCIRCLRCYHRCPKQAIQVKYSKGLRWYLRKVKDTTLKMYY